MPETGNRKMSKEIKQLLRDDFEHFFVQAFDHTHSEVKLNFDQYLKHVCHEYQELPEGGRIIFNQPPRSLKSWTAKFYAAWFLGNQPSKEVMIICNTQRLAENFVYDIRKLLRANWYRDVFPRAQIAPDRAGVTHFKTTKGGGVFAGSVEGSVAGFGADLLILDDPNKIEEDSRPERLQLVNDKFDGELYSRLNNRKKSIVVVVQHRLNQNDLSGHLINKNYKHVALPLIAPRKKIYKLADNKTWVRKKGDILVPASYSKREAESGMKLASPDGFWFYQQGVGKKTKFALRTSDFKLVENPILIGAPVISIDTAQRDSQTSSYNVIQTWQKAQETYHLCRQFREQCNFSDLTSAAIRIIKKTRPAAVLVEHATHGGALLSILRTKFTNVRFIPVEPKGSKSERLDRHRSTIRSGKISLQSGDWVAKYIEEFVTHAAHSDQIDATTQYLDFMAINPVLKPLPARATIVLASRYGTTNTPHVLPDPFAPVGLTLARGFQKYLKN
jgi:phage terminase large subunit-like protein